MMQDTTLTLDLALRQSQPLSHYQWRNLLQDLDDSDALLDLLKIDNNTLQQAVLEQYKKQKHQHWQALYEFAQSHPESISRADPRHIDIPLWRTVWQSEIKECQQWVISTLCHKLAWFNVNDDRGAELAGYFAELAQINSARLLDYLNERYINSWGSFHAPGVALLWQLHLVDFDPVMLALLATDDVAYRREQALILAYEIINTEPNYLLNVKPAKLAPLLLVLDETLVLKAAPQLLQVVSKSITQSLRETLASQFAKFNPDLLKDLGWLDKKTKNVLLTCLDILIQHPDERARIHLRTLYQTSGLDQSSKDRILSHLEASGEDISDLDELAGLSLTELAQQAATLKKISKTVEKIDHESLAALLSDVEPVLMRWLLQQLANETEERLPRSVQRILQQCPLPERQRFVEAALQQWLAHNGDPKLRWLLRLIPCGADDRLVPPLVEAVQTWHKKQKQRAVQAIRALAHIDTVFALSQVKAIAETRKYTDLLIDSAQQELRAAAKRRQQSFNDLLDELVPDFGLTDGGLELDVGPYCYRLELQGDLSLRVLSPNGKSTKSLPKAKTDEDATKHADAEATFKRLRKAIKTVSEQQVKRMQVALISARTWSASRWRLLFVDHPLLRQMTHTLIWSQRTAEGDYKGSFRLSEDLSLIDHQDEVIELQDDDSISLWHPIEADADTIENWRQHLDDYAITAPIEQVNQPQLTLKPEWQKDNKITAYQGHVFTQARFSTKMNQWGYRKGTTEDGGYIYEHHLTLTETNLSVCLSHTRMPAWMELNHEIALNHLTVYALDDKVRAHYGVDRYQAISPKKLSPTTVSMLLAQLQELAQLGEGYRDNWKKL